jgi:hypothetical protein
MQPLDYLRWDQVAVVVAQVWLYLVVREEMAGFQQAAVVVAVQRRMEPLLAQAGLAAQDSQLLQHIFKNEHKYLDDN